ncbi:MAG: hypothetical protein ACOCSR_03635, partial [Wenzhouxiangella sp.]
MNERIASNAVPRIVARALAEDLGGRGDVTSQVTIPAGARGEFNIVARTAGVLAGVSAAAETFFQVDPELVADWHCT